MSLSQNTFAAALSVVSILSCAQLAIAEPLKGSVKHDATTPISGDIFTESDPEALPAGVKFSETVSPVDPAFRPHKLFSSITMPAEDKEDTWYQIPSWRAGAFHREKQIDHTRGGDIESVSKVDHVYGMQMDKKGGIWHHMSWPRITKLSLDGYSQYKIINKYEPLNIAPNEFAVKITSTNIDVDDKSGKIIRLSKQEEFDCYYPGGTDTAQGKCLIRGFSSYGRQNTELESCSVEERRTKPFAVVNSFRGTDLRQSFKRYLETHDMASLILDNQE